MQHIDLFEAVNNHLYLVPDTGDIVYAHMLEDLTGAFASEARRLIHNEENYREAWDYQEKRSQLMETLTRPDTIHLAGYTGVIDTPEYAEDSLSLYGRPGERGTLYLGPIISHLALGKPLPSGPKCHRCIGVTRLIGIYDIEPWGDHEMQHTIMYQCPACGQYRQTGFEDGADWIGDRMIARYLVRLLPDPYVKTGRLHMIYDVRGRLLNLDGKVLHIDELFELLIDGSYHQGRVELDAWGRFFFTFSNESRPKIDLLPGMPARLLE
ncbi:MAG TPA: hypothetical protein VKR06_22285 [Ktedonosporobacter sp.]|nr:hypothetical protein [Ktedonosporobacter sp.]